jgi:hypothetical protein
MNVLPTLLIAAAVLGLCGCGGPYHRQAAGDPGGVPLRLEVELSRTYVRDLRNRGPGGRETVVYHHGFHHDHWGYYGPGYRHRYPGIRYRYDPYWSTEFYSTGPAPTSVHLLGGDGPGQARLFRTELDYGTNLIDVPVRAGRQVTLTIQAYGGYEGWEEIGSFTAADRPGQRVSIDLKEHPPRMTVTDPDGTVVEAIPRPATPPAPPPPPPAPADPATPAPPPTVPAPAPPPAAPAP